MASKLTFRRLLQRALLLDRTQIEMLDKIPDRVLDGIFRHNFNGSMATAQRVLLNRHSQIEEREVRDLESEKRKIANLGKAVEWLRGALEGSREVLFVTDNDNDGSLAQATLLEFVQAIPPEQRKRVNVEYAQPLTQVRGITLEIVAKAATARGWDRDADFLVVTADNGINNDEEVQRIKAAYPHASVIVTDHHLPDRNAVKEDDRSLIFNPKYKPTAYFREKNISGANTLGVLLTETLRPESLTVEARRHVENMAEIGRWANLLDYANADLLDMPSRPYDIDRALHLRPLLNVSNSMAPFVVAKPTARDLEDIEEVSGGAVEAKWLSERIANVAALNAMSRRLLGVVKGYDALSGSLSLKDTYATLTSAIQEEAPKFTSINPNYIEQLRPLLFNFAITGAKDTFTTEMAGFMEKVFESLRAEEREIIAALRETELLRQDRRPNSAILYPVHPSVSRVFTRKLLGKAYNRENNGFLLTLSHLTDKEASGSMRSLYPMSAIMEGQEEIERRLGVTLSFQGHEMAAGFFIRATGDTVITDKTLSALNAWLDGRVASLKEAERINMLPNVEADFASIGLLNKVNIACRAHLAGMWGVPTVLRLPRDKDGEIWVTDPETTAQVSLRSLVETKHYGYQAISTDFNGGAIVVPVEMLRAIVADRRNDLVLRMTCMDDGVYIGSQVVSHASLPELTRLAADRTDTEALAEYYEKTFAKDNFVTLSRKDFENLPYFKYNRHGTQEFNQWEALVLALLDETGQDFLSVLDTEGTGLGRAPKCFNIGAVNLHAAPGSGETLPEDEFDNRLFRDQDGREFVLTRAQMKSMVPAEEDETIEDFADIADRATVLYSSSISNGFEPAMYVYPGRAHELTPVRNRVRRDDGTVVFNRSLEGVAFSYLVAEKDFAVTKELENLTGLSNGIVKRLGQSAGKVDAAIVSRLSHTRNAEGKPAKFLFQAHNMPYDKGVVSANFRRLDDFMNAQTTSDTAKLARRAKLAYDATPVCSFEGVEGIPPKAYFYDSPYSDYSMTTFLDRIANSNKGGVFPDINARFLLRYAADTERFSIIDREKNTETLLQATLHELRTMAGTQADDEGSLTQGHRVVSDLPNNAVKYSVERMSLHAMVRNILLDKPAAISMVALNEQEEEYRSALELFQRNYHFDSSLDENIVNFHRSLSSKQENADMFQFVNMEHLGARFLHANREIQARFHDAWIYEKVLSCCEPATTRKTPNSAELEQINYLTDLPSRKIKEVYENIVEFKRRHGIAHALVHEQHNNVRFHSEDGQGLADVVYEAVLPQYLGMMKFLNPYYRSIDAAVKEMVTNNVVGSMAQQMIDREFRTEQVRDSYSMRQRTAFHRRSQTGVVKAAKEAADEGGAAGRLDTVKFKLSTDVLPPGGAIYATPRRHVTPDEVAEASELLEGIVVNEQVKVSAMTATIDGPHRQRSIDIAAANDDQSLAGRNRLMELFSHIEYDARDARMTKLADILRQAVETGSTPKLPRGYQVSPEILAMGQEMLTQLDDIYARIGKRHVWSDMAKDFLKDLTDAADKTQKRAAADAKAAEKDKEARQKMEEAYSVNAAGVRGSDFLPDLVITRREPMAFMLKHRGLEGCYAALHRAVEAETTHALLAPPQGGAAQEEAEAKPKRASRRRAKAA